MSAPEFVIIANPVSGRGRAQRMAQDAAAQLQARGQRADVRLTSTGGEAQTIAERARDEGAGCVVACGGDGTVQDVARALAQTDVPLGVLPGGRCNDFAHTLNIHRHDPLEQLVDTLEKGPVRALDLGAVTSLDEGAKTAPKYFCTVATLGFDSEVTQFVRTHRFPIKGTAEYLYGALRVLIGFRGPQVVLTGEFGRYEGTVFLAATGNSSSYGGGMYIAPGAQPDDGTFEVCVVEDVGRLTVLRIMPKVFKGTHVNHPAVRVLHSKWMEVTCPNRRHVICADGEPIGSTPARLETIPGGLKVKSTVQFRDK